MKKLFFLSWLSICAMSLNAKTLKVLFIGNSYTASNNLPDLIQNMAAEQGDTLIYEAHTPGGQSLKGHSSDSYVLNKISSGDWDYVVLQDQSQMPAFPENQVQQDVYPYAAQLNNYIKQHNPCAETIFFITWGRKNGDQGNCPNFPPLCTYEGMDSLLTLRYTTMAEDNNAFLSPVGPVWRAMRETHPSVELYSGDGSHPSAEGSYLAALTFITILFDKDPTLQNFNYTLDPQTASTIKSVTKSLVWEDMNEWTQYAHLPNADFEIEETDAMLLSFTNLSTNATSYLWDFGDGTTSTDENPTHLYEEQGTYYITLTAFKDNECNIQHSTTDSFYLETTNILPLVDINKFTLYPNPAQSNINVKSSLDFNEIRILDNIGRLIKREEFSSFNKEYNIEIEHFSNGQYFIEILKMGERVSVQSFIITK